jgi:hypothetical protein
VVWSDARGACFCGLALDVRSPVLVKRGLLRERGPKR